MKRIQKTGKTDIIHSFKYCYYPKIYKMRFLQKKRYIKSFKCVQNEMVYEKRDYT